MEDGFFLPSISLRSISVLIEPQGEVNQQVVFAMRVVILELCIVNPDLNYYYYFLALFYVAA